MNPNRKSIEILEMEEFCFANTAVDMAQRLTPGELQTYLRENYRMHRFFVFNWLVLNGVELPVALVADSLHLPVGSQQPDQRIAIAKSKDRQ